MSFDHEEHNRAQLERLNQRGGRMLSIVDLLRAETVGLDMAACAMHALARGSSLLTAARPGGAGKTTVMAALLNLLPPGVPIVTVTDASIIHRALDLPSAIAPCYLVHEIGDGPYFGYLWGKDVADYFRLLRGRGRIASCLHADTLDELQQILLSAPLNVPDELLRKVGMILFVHMDRSGDKVRRQIETFYRTQDSEYRLLFRRKPSGEGFECLADPDQRQAWQPYRDFLARLSRDEEMHLEDVSRAVAEFYRGGIP